MKNISRIFILCIVLSCVNPRALNAVDPLALLGGSAVKEGVDKLKEYWYAEQERNKQLIKKHLNKKQHKSDIVRGCNQNFSDNCTDLANYLQEMEQYNAAANESYCIEHQALILKSEKNTQVLQDDFNNQSYFQSLSDDKQERLLVLERKLVMSYSNPRNYANELILLHEALHQ